MKHECTYADFPPHPHQSSPAQTMIRFTCKFPGDENQSWMWNGIEWNGWRSWPWAPVYYFT